MGGKSDLGVPNMLGAPPTTRLELLMAHPLTQFAKLLAGPVPASIDGYVPQAGTSIENHPYGPARGLLSSSDVRLAA